MIPELLAGLTALIAGVGAWIGRGAIWRRQNAEATSAEVGAYRTRIDGLVTLVGALDAQVQGLSQKVTDLERELGAQRDSYERRIREIHTVHEKTLDALMADHREQLVRVTQEHETAMINLQSRYDAALRELAVLQPRPRQIPHPDEDREG